MTSARDFCRFAPALLKRSTEDVFDLPEQERVSLADYAREGRFSHARRMPTDD